MFKTEAQADEFIEHYCREYAPEGYGTICRKATQPDGMVVVKVSRGSSCD
jgi:hypothetical protein